MQISLSETGKRFNREWIFRKFSFQFISGETYAITGPNGSGKSTLLQVIAGAIIPSEGSVKYRDGEKEIDGDNVYRHISIAAPYQELIEEMTLAEFLEFHRKFKPFRPGLSIKDIADLVNLSGSIGKQIRNFSSGMKQRAKLAQAFFSNTPILLLDEPCTNLDVDGITLYQQLVSEYSKDRTVIVSSNNIEEYGFCKETISMSDIKKTTINAGSR